MLGKRIVARLQGKTLGACHKCGASLKRNRSCPPRARFCVICGTLYHTYDCGNRMASVLLADIPADCPKVSCIYFLPCPSNVISSRCSSSASFEARRQNHTFSTKRLQARNMFISYSPTHTANACQCCNVCRCVSGPLECHAHRNRARKEKLRKEKLRSSSEAYRESSRSKYGEARRNVEPATAGGDVFYPPSGDSPVRCEERLGPGTTVPLLEQAQTFAAMHAASSETSSSSQHACSSSASKKCETCAARRVARLLRVHRFGDAIMVYSTFMGIADESNKGS
jgi:hypothetical protein